MRDPEHPPHSLSAHPIHRSCSSMARSPASSDDEAPEALSFSSSRQAAKAQDEALQQFHATEKQKLKDRRRERDRVLKERKAQAKGKEKAGEDGDKSVDKGKRKDVEAEKSASCSSLSRPIRPLQNGGQSGGGGVSAAVVVPELG